MPAGIAFKCRVFVLRNLGQRLAERCGRTPSSALGGGGGGSCVTSAATAAATAAGFAAATQVSTPSAAAADSCGRGGRYLAGCGCARWQARRGKPLGMRRVSRRVLSVEFAFGAALLGEYAKQVNEINK